MKYTLKQYRKEILGLNQTQAGAMIGVTKQRWGKIENEPHNLSAATIFAIAEAWEVAVRLEIVEGNDTMYIITPSEIPVPEEGAGGVKEEDFLK